LKSHASFRPISMEGSMSAISSLAVCLFMAVPGAGPTQEAPAQLVQFASSRCPHCQSMQPVVQQLAAQGVGVQTVDVDAQLAVAQQYQVKGVPTFIALRGGQEVGRVEGVTTAEKLAGLVQGAGVESRGSGVGGRESGARGLAPEQVARAATVRLKVEDATGYGFGTGTIIDTHENEALVVTCGHLFRESKGQGKISADVFSAGSAQTAEGQLIAYDLDRDIALVSLRTTIAVRPVPIAPPGHSVRPSDRVFSIGCDKGADPSLRPTYITAVNKYKGKPNFTAAGQPIDGRSGGGLFSAEGFLIGICNAADPADDEGLYAGLASIHWQLDQIGQGEVYQRSARVASSSTSAPSAPAVTTPPMALAANGLPPVMPAAFRSAPDEVPVAAAGDDTEIVFIVRSKRDPAQRSEVYVVDQAPPDLIARITHAARTSGQQRAALAEEAMRASAAGPREPRLAQGR
jgi:thiol-disulfide isomerase/thioredoxin